MQVSLLIVAKCKVGPMFPMVIWSKFRMRQYKDDDHREDALHFTDMLKNDFLIDEHLGSETNSEQFLNDENHQENEH